MNLSKTLQILESILGKGKKQSKGEYLFYCPACHHYKPKLIVKLDPGYRAFQHWHCWVCQETNDTKGRSLYGLLKRFNASPEQMIELKDALGEVSYNYSEPKEIKKVLRLPKEFKPLWNDESNSIGKRHAMAELKRRKITWGDIIRYHIGYCEKGEYANRIIIPSYDENGSLNYFTARSYFKDPPLKYKNPEISKDIVAFEMFVNWSLPIVLVEGMFDAIAVRRNAIPLLGKTMSDKLYEKIVLNRPPEVFISLDQDAIRDSIKIADKLNKEQIPTYIVILGKKDPSDLGYDKMIESFRNSILNINDSSIFKLKMEHNVR